MKEDLNKITIYKNDGVDHAAVYLGGVNELEDITDRLDWHHEEHREDEFIFLTLGEIYEQVAAAGMGYALITVFQNGPLKGTVYQCGNYKSGQWVKYGTLIGYA